MQQSPHHLPQARDRPPLRQANQMEQSPQTSRSLSDVRRLRSDGMYLPLPRFTIDRSCPLPFASTVALTLHQWLRYTHSIATQNLGSKYPPNPPLPPYLQPRLMTPIRMPSDYASTNTAAEDDGPTGTDRSLQVLRYAA